MWKRMDLHCREVFRITKGKFLVGFVWFLILKIDIKKERSVWYEQGQKLEKWNINWKRKQKNGRGTNKGHEGRTNHLGCQTKTGKTNGTCEVLRHWKVKFHLQTKTKDLISSPHSIPSMPIAKLDYVFFPLKPFNTCILLSHAILFQCSRKTSFSIFPLRVNVKLFLYA